MQHIQALLAHCSTCCAFRPRLLSSLHWTIAWVCRPRQKSRARYYAVVTLNQMVLSHSAKQGGSALAVKLIDIYFSLFQLTLDHKIGVAAERAAATDGTADGGTQQDTKAGSAKQPKAPAKGRHKHRKGRGKGPAAKQGASAAAQPAGAQEADARMLGALLTGIRRAYPYVDGSALDEVFATHATPLFRTVHAAPFTVSTQALMLLFQVRG